MAMTYPDPLDPNIGTTHCPAGTKLCDDCRAILNSDPIEPTASEHTHKFTEERLYSGAKLVYCKECNTSTPQASDPIDRELDDELDEKLTTIIQSVPLHHPEIGDYSLWDICDKDGDEYGYIMFKKLKALMAQERDELLDELREELMLYTHPSDRYMRDEALFVIHSKRTKEEKDGR